MSISILPSVESQINHYLSHPNTKSLAKSTQSSYGYILKTHLLPFCDYAGIIKIDDSLKVRLEEFIRFLSARGLDPYSIQHYLTVVKFFAKFVGHQVHHTYKIPRAAKQTHDLKHQKRWFSDRDIALCKTYRFRRNNLRSHVLVRLFIETGARVDEIAHIRLGDVNTRENTILLGRSKTIPRTVFFNQETGIFLENFLRRDFPEGSDPMAFIFPGKNRIYKIVIEMLKDLGLKTSGDGRGPHTFRHYTATFLHYVQGWELTHVAALLGDTPETISSRYLHPTPQMLQGRFKQASGW